MLSSQPFQKFLVRSASSVRIHAPAMPNARIHTLAGGIVTLFLLALIVGCASRPRADAYRHTPSELRDTHKSQELAQKAASLMQNNPNEAERVLRDAITADLFNGPAHNNLGVLYLSHDRLYDAASEFEWARQLMPGHPDPRVNLALTLERAGRADEALATYRTALEVAPGNIGAIQALTRLQLLAGRTDEATVTNLDEISLRGESDEWRSWARFQSLRLKPKTP